MVNWNDMNQSPRHKLRLNKSSRTLIFNQFKTNYSFWTGIFGQSDDVLPVYGELPIANCQLIHEISDLAHSDTLDEAVVLICT